MSAAESVDLGRWLGERQHHVGASEVAAVLGVSPWSSPLEVYARKVGAEPEPRPDEDRDLRFALGHFLEPFLLGLVAERTGLVVSAWPQDQHWIHPRVRVLSCTPDGLVEPNGLCQCKTSLGWAAIERFGGGLPREVVIQCQAEMACTERAFDVVPILMPGPTVALHRVDRDERTISLIERYVPAWWERHVEAGVPPAANGSESAKRALAALYPAPAGPVVELPVEAEELSARLEEVEAQAKDLASQKAEIQNRIRALIGSAEGGRLASGGGWTWHTVERAEHMVAASSSRVLRRVKKL